MSRRTAVALGLAGALFGAFQQPAVGTHTGVTAVAGSAFGYHADDIRFVGNLEPDSGPEPTVALAPDASNSPQNSSVPTALVLGGQGAATLLTSDTITTSASGSLGSSGSASSSSTLTNVNKATSQPGTGGEILTADSIGSTCTATQSGTTLTTTITNGSVQTDSGLNLNPSQDDDFTDPGEHPPTFISVPSNPSPGFFIDGHIHVNNAVDDFRIVFNEQSAGTVTAAHEILGTSPPDLLTGHLYLGRSVCGVTTGPGPNAPPVAVDDGPYATPFETPLTVVAPGGLLANDTDVDGGALTAGSASNPPKGSVTLNADGSFTYTPDAGATGSDSFTYVVTDDHGATDTGTMSITIGAPPADVAVTLSAPSPVDVRVPFDYEVTVSNGGPSDATGVSVHTTIKGVKFVGATGATCVTVKGKNAGVRCDLGTLADGASVPITITVTTGAKPATLTNTSTVTTTSTDNDLADNSEDETTSVQRL